MVARAFAHNRIHLFTTAFVNYFHKLHFQYMLFWLLKDAQLACKRCPLATLLTPF